MLDEIDKELKNYDTNNKSIIIKQIKGKKYYYAQWKQDGRLHTQYLSQVAPGAVSHIETEMKNKQNLLDKKRDLEGLLKYVEQMLKNMEKDIKKERMIEDYDFEVFWKDEITAKVRVRGKKVRVSRYTAHPLKQLFAEEHMTRYQLNQILEMRCWERGRADIDLILKHLGLEEYNPYEIVKKTHGVSYNDYIWFRFWGENITSDDVLVR